MANNFYDKNFPFNMMGQQQKVPPSFNQNFPPPFWHTNNHPQTFETFVKLHQFHQQQMAKSQATSTQAPSNPQSNKLQQLPSIFDHIDGFMNTANKYYPYMKKAGTFLNNFNKFF